MHFYIFSYFKWLASSAIGIGLFVLAAAASLPGHAAAANGGIPPAVEKAIGAILASRGPEAPLPDASTMKVFLDYVMSPVNPVQPSGEAVYPAKRSKEGHGIYWRAVINAPLKKVLRYLYDPKLPGEVAYPASLRVQRWLPGSPFANLSPGLWERLGQNKERPFAVRGVEFEEITPDTFSGAYYSYTMDRLFILTENEGRQALVTVSWQKDRSAVGKKAVPIGPYENWDFVYSGAPGTLASGIGWADTYMYASCAIIVFYEDSPGSNVTRYAVFKWLDAGWSGMNMVKRNHIEDGARRSFSGLKAFVESNKLPPAEEIVSYVAGLRAMDEEALRKKFAPYAAKVSAAAAQNEVLRSADFQKVIADNGYGNSLSKEELISALSVAWIKEKLGRPLLAGPL